MPVISLVVNESNLSYSATITKNMMHPKHINIKKMFSGYKKRIIF